eukprot:3797498-Prymnesium_polylepis.1
MLPGKSPNHPTLPSSLTLTPAENFPWPLKRYNWAPSSVPDKERQMRTMASLGTHSESWHASGAADLTGIVRNATEMFSGHGL